MDSTSRAKRRAPDARNASVGSNNKQQKLEEGSQSHVNYWLMSLQEPAPMLILRKIPRRAVLFLRIWWTKDPMDTTTAKLLGVKR
jgi:hypothetical protein